MFVEVLVEINAKKLDKTFTYEVPNLLHNSIEIGKRVLVPFANRNIEGFILNISKEKTFDYKVKRVVSIIDEEPVLNDEMLKLGLYIKEKTLSPLISVYQTMLPPSYKAKNGKKISKKYINYLVVNNYDVEKLTKKQQEIMELFKNNVELLKSDCDKVSAGAVKTLIEKNILKVIKREVYRLNNNESIKQPKNKLTKEQSEVISKISSRMNLFHPFLLYGVTGSGKTEIYLNMVSAAIKSGKEAIVLVPEISLTPQMVSKFTQLFGNKVAVIHSGISAAEKYDEWRKIIRKEVSVVVGARSAIFAPFTNLGLIVIDEEHSSTYKQDTTPKYSAIDVAIIRAKKYKCPLILGSATPSLESFTRSKLGVYELLTLKERINKTIPTIELVDMRDEIRKNNRLFSEKLLIKIQERLNRKEQVIILLNRRGYSTTLMCQNCGEVVMCPNCDIPLTYHKSKETLKCHYCDYNKEVINNCTSCNSNKINYFGIGTERVVESLQDLFKNSRIVRMDVDTTSKKGSHEKIIKSFGNYEYDILVGTQMISKGLDFAKVTLVGVINGDASLNIPDFRSAERTFQLLNQVSGRSGRGDAPGEVVIQAYNLDHYSIRYAVGNDYDGFYKEELEVRKKLGYPPFYNLSLIKLSGEKYDEVEKNAHKIVDFLNTSKIKDLIILGPSSPLLPKINNIYYLQIILKYKKSQVIYEKLCELENIYLNSRVVNLDIDLNPSRM